MNKSKIESIKEILSDGFEMDLFNAFERYSLYFLIFTSLFTIRYTNDLKYWKRMTSLHNRVGWL